MADKELQGRVAVITGGAQGIGEAGDGGRIGGLPDATLQVRQAAHAQARLLRERLLRESSRQAMPPQQRSE